MSSQRTLKLVGSVLFAMALVIIGVGVRAGTAISVISPPVQSSEAGNVAQVFVSVLIAFLLVIQIIALRDDYKDLGQKTGDGSEFIEFVTRPGRRFLLSSVSLVILTLLFVDWSFSAAGLKKK